eukprot:1161574-Pelagomonas_calceolata.AAC.4
MDGGAVTQIRVNAAPICLKRGLMQKLVDGSAVTQIMFIAALIVVAQGPDLAEEGGGGEREAHLHVKSVEKIGLVGAGVLGCSNRGKCGGIKGFQPYQSCPIHPHVCSSDKPDIIAKGMASTSGLFGTGWQKMSGGLGGPSEPEHLFSIRSSSASFFFTFFYI